MQAKGFQTLLKLEKLRLRGEAPQNTPHLTVDQVLSRAEVLPETVHCNPDLLDFFLRHAEELFIKAVESSAWAQKSQKGHTHSVPSFTVPLIGPSERIRFNCIATEIICTLLKYSPGEEVIVARKGLYIRFNSLFMCCR